MTQQFTYLCAFCIPQKVTVVGKRNNVAGLTSANIKLRISRNPAIGDKFASRAGQKGILSQKWPDINMPYCAMTGMRPDLLINPHAFPSRMTIGMLVESLASKGGALVGKFVDCSPFRKCDEGDAYGRSSSPTSQLNHHSVQLNCTTPLFSLSASASMTAAAPELLIYLTLTCEDGQIPNHDEHSH